MQAGDDPAAADAAQQMQLQNAMASLLSAALSGGPLPGAPPGAGFPGLPNGVLDGNHDLGADAAAAGAPLLLLPPGIQDLQSLAPFLLNMGALGGPNGALPYGLLPGLDPNIAAAILAQGADLDLEAQGLDQQRMDQSQKTGMAGSKRPAEGSMGGPYKRERSEEGRAREGKCHVEGCNVELASLSSYYQRYRTCEAHLKAPSILKDGVQQRFCQQCGRFHELCEFDGAKRSCRARLQSHNQRRRKRTEEQMANQQAQENHQAQAALQAQANMQNSNMQQLLASGHLLGQTAPNLAEMLQMAAAGTLPPDALNALAAMPPAGVDESLMSLLQMLPPNLDPASLAALAGGELALPLLDSLKGAGGLGPGGPADLNQDMLQQTLALALAGAPAAATSIVGDGGLSAAGLMAQLQGDAHHLTSEQHKVAAELAAAAAAAAAAGVPGLNLGVDAHGADGQDLH